MPYAFPAGRALFLLWQYALIVGTPPRQAGSCSSIIRAVPKQADSYALFVNQVVQQPGSYT